jgi:hypothetical protein
MKQSARTRTICKFMGLAVLIASTVTFASAQVSNPVKTPGQAQNHKAASAAKSGNAKAAAGKATAKSQTTAQPATVVPSAANSANTLPSAALPAPPGWVPQAQVQAQTTAQKASVRSHQKGQASTVQLHTREKKPTDNRHHQ